MIKKLWSSVRQTPTAEMLLPQAEWAQSVISDWLEGLKKDCEGPLLGLLEGQAMDLIVFRRFVENYEPDPELSESVRKQARKKMAELPEKMHALYELSFLGAELEALSEWTVPSLLPRLFEYNFREFTNSPAESMSDLIRSDKTGLALAVKDGLSTRDVILKGIEGKS